MNASVEISMYPLLPDYGISILKFIAKLKEHSGLRVKSNTMSTQIFGEYDYLMGVLNREMKAALQSEDAVVMVLKIVNLDLSPDDN